MLARIMLDILGTALGYMLMELAKWLIGLPFLLDWWQYLPTVPPLAI